MDVGMSITIYEMLYYIRTKLQCTFKNKGKLKQKQKLVFYLFYFMFKTNNNLGFYF